MSSVLINPPASLLGSTNAVLHGRGARRYEHRFAGPLSIKAVLRGRATWETERGRFELVPGMALLINEGEEYRITVDAPQPVETFCFFFERGFVEGSPPFCEPLQFNPRLLAILRAARSGEASLDESFYAAGLELLRAHASTASRAARLPSLRASTRDELARRLRIATEYLHANADRTVTIAEAARAACLSPFHFHRLFTRFHGITPHRYLAGLRLDRARAMLQATGESVAAVAYACGFGSVGSFATLFKRTFGVTPGKSKNRECTPAPDALP